MGCKVMRLSATSAERDGSGHIVTGGTSINVPPEPDGDKCVDRAQGVVRNDEPKILQGVSIRVVAAANRSPELGVLQLSVRPRPLIVWPNRAFAVELLSELVFG